MRALRGLGLPPGTRKPPANVLPPAPLQCWARTERATSTPGVAWGLRSAVPGLPPPARSLPAGPAAPRSTGQSGTARGEERRASPRPPAQPLALPLSLSLSPFPFPFQGCIPTGTANRHGRNQAWPLSASPMVLFQRGPGGPRRPARKRSKARRRAWSPEPGSASRSLRSHDGSWRIAIRM